MSKPLRIGFLTAYGPQQGTLFRWINLAKGLRALGHEVTVYGIEAVANAARVSEEREGIPHRIIRASRGQRWFGGFSHPVNVLSQAMSDFNGLDILHAFQPFSVTCLPALMRRNSAKALLWDWDDLWYGGIIPTEGARKPAHGRINVAMIRLLERRMASWVDAVTTCSGWLAERAIAAGGRSVKVLHNGFWPEAPRMERAAARARLGLKAETYYCGFMGRTIHELDWCLDTLRLTENTMPELRLALCGMGREALANIPAGLMPRIDYLGFLSPEDARVFAQSLNCGLLPLEDIDFNRSRFPIKFAEYLAAGCDLLCSAVGELAGLAAGMDGVTLAKPTREEWRKALGEHLGHAVMQRELSARDALLAERLAWMKIAVELEQFYIKTLTSN